MTPDGLPIIGRLGRLVNTYVATGHGMLGVTLAPGTAAALTELIVRGVSAPVLEPFAASRFGRRRLSSGHSERQTDCLEPVCRPAEHEWRHWASALCRAAVLA